MMSMSILMVVVLPAPLGPTIPNISPDLTSKEMSSTTSFLPKDLCTPETSTVFVSSSILLGDKRESHSSVAVISLEVL
ncbi:MAG: hypothetical protein DDT28_00614 [Dehalococcoidia bacterium]|nr:hypothetical protein [Chloroflexota bacterium]